MQTITKRVNLNTVQSVNEVVTAASGVSARIEVRHNNFVVDGHSILGVLSLDLSEPVEFKIESENLAEPKTATFLKVLDKFLI